MDRPINRLIKSALEVVSRTSVDSVNQQLCRELLFWFDRVPTTRDVESDFRTVRYDRLVQHYQLTLPTCRLILKGLNPLTQRGENRAFSMLFPMSTVFEDYVASKLKTQYPEWGVKTQVRSRSLVERHRGKMIFRLQPDLKFIQRKDRMIGDTKWKLIDQDDRANNYKIAQADVYQLFAYAKKYLANQPIKKVMLIYPRTDHFDRPLDVFWYQRDHEALYVLPYDLERDTLITSDDSSPFEIDSQLTDELAA